MWQLVASLAMVSSVVGGEPISKDVFLHLTQMGVPLQSGQMVRLPAPVLPDGLDAPQQAEILKRVAGKFPLDRFLRDAVVSPFVLEIESIGGEGQRGGQRVDFYFVAYGTRKALLAEGLFSDLVGAREEKSSGSEPWSTHTLTPEELAARKLVVRETPELSESFVAVDVPILERVQLQGVGIGVKQQNADSLVGAWMLDPRFQGDSQFPNQWRPILRDQAGRMSLGEATPYAGLGGYTKLTWLHEPAGAVLVECHAAFDEPHGWFEGKNFLRSKLPLVVQDNVRDFRRKLAKRSKE
ncbi:MAG: hypothetical protein JNG90_07590 [Planctomycetaceae bacterium]|nr:hypothetical protein [Planctomycetaceae bacterium]